METDLIRAALRPLPRPDTPRDLRFGVRAADEALAFHRTIPGYAPTPLVSLPALAAALGTGAIRVKDESFRFGLNAFKVLGGSFALGRCCAARLGLDPAELSFARLTAPEARRRLSALTFVTATDGNHGRGVAWTAARLGQRSVVYMPAGSAAERLENIRALGAAAEITDLSYDDAVRLARRRAEENGWIVVQDTAWEGYEEIPAWIMQGYTTMAREIAAQLDGDKPTHLFLQAGVGSMAGAVAAFCADCCGGVPPRIIVVEPQGADCLFRTAAAGDGALHPYPGRMETIMAGLACGEPCPLGWRVLDAWAAAFLSVPDAVAAEGMRLLARPRGDDPAVVSGESGAVTLGTAAALLRDEGLRPLRERLGLGPDSRILCISTEGDTDRENYRRILAGAVPLSAPLRWTT